MSGMSGMSGSCVALGWLGGSTKQKPKPKPKPKTNPNKASLSFALDPLLHHSSSTVIARILLLSVDWPHRLGDVRWGAVLLACHGSMDDKCEEG